RLFGSRIRPCARPSGPFPNLAISPAASASTNERWDGMVKTAGRSGILEDRFRQRNRLRGADVEPQTLMHRAERAAFLDRAVPQDIGREWPLRRVPEQPLRGHLD